ncbi:MAG: class I SAM-dependent methyltransferase [Acidobacteriota bacterium]
MSKRNKNRKSNPQNAPEVQQTLPAIADLPAVLPEVPSLVVPRPVVPSPIDKQPLVETVVPVALAVQPQPKPVPPLDGVEIGPCPACGTAWVKVLFTSTDRLYATTSEEFQVVECCSCRLIRLHPQPRPDQLPSYYPRDYWFTPAEGTADRLEQWYRRLVLGDHVRFVHRAIVESKASGTVLDVGCGGGLFLRLLADRFQAAPPGSGSVARTNREQPLTLPSPFVGLDFSLDAAKAAWGHLGVPVTCGTLASAPLAPGSCAAVTMFHVLEHLYDPGSYLEAAHGLLKPGGRLIVQVPNAGCWQFLLFGERWNGIDVPRHLIDFKTSDLDMLLDACGFEVIRHKYFSLRDNPAGLATTLAVHLDPMSRRLRHVEESDRMRLFKDLVYTGLVVASIPFTVLEAACRAGSTIMVEARKKS